MHEAWTLGPESRPKIATTAPASAIATTTPPISHGARRFRGFVVEAWCDMGVAGCLTWTRREATGSCWAGR